MAFSTGRETDEDLREHSELTPPPPPSLPIHQSSVFVDTISLPPKKLFPHVKYVMDKFRHKLPKDVLKRHAKDVSKTLVSSDYKHNRVEDPTFISDKQEKKVKKYVKDFLDKAVVKHHEHEKRKSERPVADGSEKAGDLSTTEAVVSVETPGAPIADDDVVMSDVEDMPASSPERKRKRDEDIDLPDASLTPEEPPLMKRLKEEDTAEDMSPPPPPPPPPEAGMAGMTPSQVDEFSHEQEEEAQRLADEAEQDRIRQEEALQRENEEAMREFELEQKNQHAATSNGMVNGGTYSGTGCDGEAMKHENDGRNNNQEILGQ